MRRAWVIRTAGDPMFAGAIVDGLTTSTANSGREATRALQTEELEIVKAELDRLRTERSDELAKVKAEVDRLRIKEAEHGVRKVRDNKYFSKRIRKARKKYAVKPPSKPAQFALILWAMTTFAVHEGFRRLAIMNRQ